MSIIVKLEGGAYELSLEHASKVPFINDLLAQDVIEEVDLQMFDLQSFESIVVYIEIIKTIPEPEIKFPIDETSKNFFDVVHP